MKSLFRYSPKDIYLILFASLVFAIPIIIASSDCTLGTWIALSIPHIWFIVICQNSSLHNHAHCPIFNSKRLNRIYELFVSATTGIPHHSWKSAHLIHHIHVNDNPVTGKPNDPASVYANGELINFWVYCFILLKENIKYYFFTITPYFLTNKKYANEYKQEMWAFRVFLLLIFFINFYYGVFLVITYILAYVVNNANSYGEHWGALQRRGDTTQDSIGIYSKWYNWMCFNAGYHQEHHHKPGVHWSKLPEVTPLLHPDRVIVKHGIHILNNPFWSPFVALIKGEKVESK